ncbi:class I SAM-dependent DNA methyltransferase [Candidatus Nomurabacteria bacterium]|nr:class I SAM-dependent DNA methyltransferase [Candidatus Nomurabacteria bacterium]
MSIPYSDEGNPVIATRVESCVEISKWDWDLFETSYDFQKQPILCCMSQGFGIGDFYKKIRDLWIENTLKMQEHEEESNRIFIEAYGLQEELSPMVPLKEITLTCNPYYRYGMEADQVTGSREFPLQKDLEDRLLSDTMKELISYSVGCMFGRYSLDKPGLILANQGEALEDYMCQVLNPSFVPDKDNVIPLLEGEWFIDDIVSRFTDFLRVAFGTEKYSENISFIEEAIGKPLRNYFLKDFYNDHVKRYKKRPIYWLFSSPNGSFNALIYMHRYTPDTASIILNGYLREYIHKLRAKVSQLEHQLNAGDQNERDKMLTRKDIDRLQDVISELEAWESKVILPLAEKRLELDLDDGVKVNYAKFGTALKDLR